LGFDLPAPVPWEPPPPVLALTEQELHIWRASLDQPSALLSRLAGLLSEDESARSNRFYFERDRQHYVAGRAILRTILGQYLGIPPEQIRFQYGKHGKPALPGTSPLHFNLAHSNNLILLAFTLRHEIGVDVEYLRLVPETDEIARHFFTEMETQTLINLPEDQKLEGFFTHWVCKEAYLKGLGDGLARPLDTFEILPPLALHVIDNPEESARWSLRLFRPEEGYLSAIAMDKKGLKTFFWQWDDDLPKTD